MEHLARWAVIRTKDILSRLNLISFNYTLSLLLNKSSRSSVHDELALLFVSQDVYHEQFYHGDRETSALVQLKKQGFKELHECSIDAQNKTGICNSETLQVNIDLGEDFNLADIKNENIRFTVDSYAWWNAGKVIKIPLARRRKKGVGILCGKITLQGEYGHTSIKHFTERDLCGFVRSLLGVEEVIFNVTPIAKLLQMPEESINQVTKSWQGEDKQLNIILTHWLTKGVELDVLAALRKCLEGLNQEDYRVTKRGQMHIRHLREIANRISDLQCVNAGLMEYFSNKVRTLCKSVMRDCCIELEDSAEGVERAASSSNHADYLINHFIENHQPIPDDTAQKYKEVCLQSGNSSIRTFLAIAPHLIQNIKEIFVDDESIVPQNGLRGLSKETVCLFLSSVQNAQRNYNLCELVYQECKILEKLCLKNDDKQSTEEIKIWGNTLGIFQMLRFLKHKQFFQHCRQDVRLYKRLDLLSCHPRYLVLDQDTDEVFMHDFSNVLQSLIHFAKFDPSKLVRFEMFDSTNTPLTCHREKVKYDKHGNTYSQRFDIKKELEDELQLHAIAHVRIGGREVDEKGAFQSVIMLNASGEEAFDTCMKRFDVAVMKVEDKSSENLRLVLCSTQKGKVIEALDALTRELSEDLLVSESKITQCHLHMRSIDPAAGAVLSLRLVYVWGSEAVTLDSKDFITFADSSACGACIPEVQLKGLDEALMAEGAAAFPLTSADGKFPLGSFDQLQRRGRVQCEKIGNSEVPCSILYIC